MWRRTFITNAIFGVQLLLCLSASSGSAVAAETSAPYVHCPIAVRVYALKQHEDELLFALWSDDAAGVASGSIVVYAGGRKHTLRFVGATAADDRNAKIVPTPIVVRFAAPIHFESAYVSSLQNDACPVHGPAVSADLETFVKQYETSDVRPYADWKRVWPDYLAQASSAQPITADRGEPEETASCEHPYVMAYTKTSVPAEEALPSGDTVEVHVLLGPDGHVLGTRVDRHGPTQPMDESARIATQKSTFSPQIYRCAPVSGIYSFIVQF